MDTRLSDLTIAELLDRLASDAPVPGGGSASALAGAMGAALLEMVVALTTGTADGAGQEDELREIGLAAAGLRSDLLRLAEADAAAYASVVAARRLPRDTARELEARRVQVDAATREATRAPREVARRCHDVLTLAERLVTVGRRAAISDVGVAALLAVAGLRGGAANVEINLPLLPADDELRAEAARDVVSLLEGVDERAAALRATVTDRIG